MNRSFRSFVLAVIVAAFTAGCEPSIVNVKPDLPAQNGLRIEGDTNSPFIEGDFKGLKAWAEYNIGPDKDVTAQAVWTSSTPPVATVAMGMVSAVSPGEAVVTATHGGFTATRTIAVSAKPVVLAGIAIVGDSVQERAGSYQYRCLGKYSDGTEKEVVCLWEYYSPSGPNHLPGEVDSLGVVTLNTIGVASIIATFEGHQRSLSVRLTGTPASDIDPMPEAVWEIVKLSNNPYGGVQHLDISKPITYWVGPGIPIQGVQDGLVYWIEELQDLGVQFVQVSDSAQAIAPIYRDPTVPAGYCAFTSPKSGIGVTTNTSLTVCVSALIMAHEWGHMFALPHFGSPGSDIMSMPGPAWIHHPVRQEALRRILGIPNGTIIVGTPTLT
ncbi:hypothetical protein COU49_00535 [Candidatus Nomurabacteria bacterium CG10_big_fil_rev_8_21_14_0_10_35_16]|uniref:BIG2 domain-containing protein n=1 Tax=Candidatus Nomurabacteria bacterium CG10_big_fil_rev_8_21_14_0_10_35_16 TaxID=1974731 RepID=A0A2H0TBX2_9BACT|nr:MAG: hypothetical protein COU49_00535 [Candidatus Nomurabacteria bacterium CG10_big_fil_rev_8_21_14_0_10_35_16]